MKLPSGQRIIAEEIVEEVVDEDQPPVKISRVETTKSSNNRNESWNRSIGVMSKKSSLSNLVKNNKKSNDSSDKPHDTVNAVVVTDNVVEPSKGSNISNDSIDKKPAVSALSLLADYSGTDSE